MAKRFSSLTKSKTELLHRELRSKYEDFSEIELEKLYQKLKSEHESLKTYADLQKQDEDKNKELNNKRKVANLEVKREERAAYSRMSTLQQIGSIFSTPKQLSQAHEEAMRKENQLHALYMSHKTDKYKAELARRKKIYHELKVLSELRKQIKDKRVRSLANATIKKVRSTSSATKRKHVSKSGNVIPCPYCERTHETVEMVLDHIYPVAKGGLDTDENTVLVCKQCNTKKSDKTLMVFCTQMKFDYTKVGARLMKMGKGV